jgi:hypothetical protein
LHAGTLVGTSRALADSPRSTHPKPSGFQTDALGQCQRNNCGASGKLLSIDMKRIGVLTVEWIVGCRR